MNRSLQVASTLSAENEILRSETRAELARVVSDFGASIKGNLAQFQESVLKPAVASP
jgi:hypothetical protein